MAEREFTILDVLKSTVNLFRQNDTPTLGAALSYYMIFSIAPVIIIVISIVGMVLGPQAVQGEIKDQLQDFLGPRGARQMEHVITTFYHPGKNLVTTILATALLIVGSTSVFGQIRKSLNVIWDVKPHSKAPVMQFFVNRLFSFGMIICIAFLLLVSLVLQAGVTAFTDVLSANFASHKILLMYSVHHLLSVVIATVLFAFVFKFLSDAKLRWSSVWEGALFTAVLFIIGKHLISLYIGTTHLASTYGAVGSAVVIMAWVFYSSQIVFFGAAFTRALAMHRGLSLDTYAIESDQEASDKANKL
jgi:membrane protein